MCNPQSKESQELLDEVLLQELSEEEMQLLSGGFLWFDSLSDVVPIDPDRPLFNFELARRTRYKF